MLNFLTIMSIDQNKRTAMTNHESGPGSIVRTEFLKLLREDYQGEVDDIPLADLGIDSLDFFDKLLYLEDELGIRIPIQELDDKITLRELTDIAGS